MGLMEYIKNNKWIQFLSIVVLVGGTVAGVMIWVYSEQIKLLTMEKNIEIAEKNLIINSINRGGDKDKYFDISKICIQKDSIPQINPNTKYFQEDSFYALNSSDKVSYDSYGAADYYKKFNSKRLEESDAKNGHEIFHVWMFDENFILDDFCDLENISPRIVVLKMPISEMKFELLVTMREIQKLKSDRLFQKKVEELKKLVPDDIAWKESYLENFIRIFDGCVDAFFLKEYLKVGIDRMTSCDRYKYSLQSVSKKGNVIYMHSLATLSNVYINRIKYDKFFLRNERFLITSTKFVYLINIIVPNTDPSYNNKYFGYITRWLNNFRIVMDL